MANLNAFNDPHDEERGQIFRRINQALPGAETVKSEKALALTDDNRVVPHDHEEAAYLLVGENGSLPADVAHDLGVKAKPVKSEDDDEKPAPKRGGVRMEHARQ